MVLVPVAMAKPLVACGFFVGIIAVTIATVASETFHFPDFVAIERNEVPVCGGWIIDKTFRRYVLATERCAADAADVRELLVRHGSAKVNWRTLSSGVDRKLYHPSHERLVVLSTFGKFRRQAPSYAPQHHNGTVLLVWAKRNAGVLEKTALVLADDQDRQLARLAGDLMCKSPAGAFVFDGALVLRNLKPYAMLSVHPERGNCGSVVEVVELGDLTSEWRVSVLKATKGDFSPERLEQSKENPGWFTEANSPFGYIMYTIFLAYSMLYTMLYFTKAIGKPPASGYGRQPGGAAAPEPSEVEGNQRYGPPYDDGTPALLGAGPGSGSGSSSGGNRSGRESGSGGSSSSRRCCGGPLDGRIFPDWEAGRQEDGQNRAVASYSGTPGQRR